MQDPHVDIAMFSIYSMYNKEHIDRLIDIYFQNECDQTTRAKIYAYVAACGLLCQTGVNSSTIWEWNLENTPPSSHATQKTIKILQGN